MGFLHAITLVFIFKWEQYICEENFYVPFQTQSIGADDQSLDQWLDFTVEINSSKEITSCQWIRTRYCNSDIAWNLWSYCVVEKNGEEMDCIQTYLSNLPKSANRDVLMTVDILEPSKGYRLRRRAEIKGLHHQPSPGRHISTIMEITLQLKKCYMIMVALYSNHLR